MDSQARISIGRKDVDPSLPSHVPGVHEGNWPLRMWRRARFGRPAGADGAQRSTGISPGVHGTLDPRMPRLTPP